MKGLLYPIFGILVVGTYAVLNLTGIDPFAAGTERQLGDPGIHSAGAVGLVGVSSRSGYRRGK